GGASPGQPSRGEKPAGTCTFGFNVKDLKRTCAQLEEKGVRFMMPPTERPNEGIMLAICADPDGLAISLSQSL
ncbi:MAG TPA: VOC family protein, partial [Bdellovibrionales bacterium]|nr:VOC family protein [Bdellovibrionales bacterium]